MKREAGTHKSSEALPFVTGNKWKFQEAQSVLSEFGITIRMLDIGKREIQSNDLKKIATSSAVDAVRRVERAIIVEDAGLFIKALAGFPGPFSSYVLGTIGLKGILRLMTREVGREAHFKSVVVFAEPPGKTRAFLGIVKGKISGRVRGSHGFGFDPIFTPKGDKRTFAEMSMEEKNRVSHRSKAIRKFAAWYKSHRS